MKSINFHIIYEIKVNTLPLNNLLSIGADNKSEDTTDDEYKEATEEDIDLLAQFLGGGL